MSSTAVVPTTILAAAVVLAVADRFRRGRAHRGGDGPGGGPPAPL